jgi:hypothetical protein
MTTKVISMCREDAIDNNVRARARHFFINVCEEKTRVSSAKKRHEFLRIGSMFAA